ncbi:MAG: NUDIX hydrolase [Gammaproteobacteria bacterium]
MESKPINPAATVMLVRDQNQQLEVLMVKRNTYGSFGNLFVFPGGKLDTEDQDPTLYARCHGLTDLQASKVLGIARDGLAYWVAVARECFEEVGIIIGTGNFSKGRLKEDRVLLNEGTISFAQLLEKYDVNISVKNIAYCAHWITPTIEPKRFTTRFFVALAPSDIEGWHDGAELTDSLWITPSEALMEHQAGNFNLIMPTIKNLQVLSSFSSSLEVINHFNQLPIGVVETILPKFYKENGQWHGLLPGDYGYDEL